MHVLQEGLVLLELVLGAWLVATELVTSDEVLITVENCLPFHLRYFLNLIYNIAQLEFGLI